MNQIDLKDALLKFFKRAMWIDGNWNDSLSDLAEQLGLIEYTEVTEPCCPDCACKKLGVEFPAGCFKYTDALEVD